MYKQLDLFAMMAAEAEKVEKTSIVEKPVPVAEAEPPKVNIAVIAPDVVHTKAAAPVVTFLSEPKVAVKKAVKQKRGRKSLKEMGAEASYIEIPPDEILFKKQYYSIGEVAVMFSLNTSLLRYWETEFDILKPRKNRKGDRHFRPEDIKNLLLIHHLLRQRKYTIEGAKDYLKKNKQKAQENFVLIQKLEKLKGFLLELKAGL